MKCNMSERKLFSFSMGLGFDENMFSKIYLANIFSKLFVVTCKNAPFPYYLLIMSFNNMLISSKSLFTRPDFHNVTQIHGIRAYYLINICNPQRNSETYTRRTTTSAVGSFLHEFARILLSIVGLYLKTTKFNVVRPQFISFKPH